MEGPAKESRSSPHDGIAVNVERVSKSFGDVKALDSVSLEVKSGTVVGLLGPNGAGKTTLVRILTTLLRPDSGKATVLGLNVVGQAAQVRRVIGLAGQSAAVDENLTGRENIEMVGRLYHLRRREALNRADELLEMFGLRGAAGRQVKTYSGGMRRRLDLAATLVARPKVLFLDEPTTGLDPRSRLDLWAAIQSLVASGVTVLLTTQYLEEADRLAESIFIIDNGKVIAKGTSAELKARVGGQVLVLKPADRSRANGLANILEPFSTDPPTLDEQTGEVVLSIAGGAERLPEVMRIVEAAGVVLADLTCRQPTLDDVFLSLTGHTTQASSGSDVQRDADAANLPGGRQP